MIDVAFFTHGLPKAQPRPRAFVRGRRASVFDPGTAKQWKLQVALAARAQQPEHPIVGPCAVAMIFYLPRPQRLETKSADPGRVPHIARPDLDNLAKAVLDALTDDDWFMDDAQVVQLDLQKWYAARDSSVGAAVRILQLHPDGTQPSPN
jgi:Holliday junction resolvase RusA-like endonuclease